ncbi:FAD-binding oxidoreductase [Nitrosomonas sp. Nm132]|jgi:hypothetical protein|uniref:FAD-binding oxidoreductase n=1 Tax=Nitrosomonas sp. Nm132 TaxID=1881053 RepID=UPI00088476DF|nr:FAD-binding oxidoreductase [Nitrosomonas sp. Nm132]SDH91990.1 FAD binding domain-containing protein [Nitrosomonas sp. Nm132]
MMNIACFLSSLADELGSNHVLNQSEAEAKYGICTTGVRRIIPGAIRPDSQQDVIKIVKASKKFSVPLYPISTGNNWGYGSANPATDGCVVVDLSGMKNIIFDDETGLVTLEPGVTQRILRSYLDERSLRFLCPVTGAGPDCSLIGNALERGFGITPHADHFSSVMSLEAVLPDGTVYKSPLAELGCIDIDRSFKWGVGPFLDGIFSQGSFGIVTQMTIALARTPEKIVAFFFGLSQNADLEQTVGSIQTVLSEVGGMLGSINLMNMHRVLSMIEPYPSDQLGQNGLIKNEYLLEMAHRNQVMPWVGAGAIYGNARVVSAVKSVIKDRLGHIVKRLVFFTSESISYLNRFSHYMPGKVGRRLRRVFGSLDKTMSILSGYPSEVALPLSYWISGNTPEKGVSMNPARDGCGLIWYSPLVPMHPDKVRLYTEMVYDICRKYRFEPLITLTSESSHCFISTVPLLFDRSSNKAIERAQQCYSSLLEAGWKIGCVPYRVSIESMPFLIKPETPYWQIVKTLKRNLDPQDLIAPGRYAPRLNNKTMV